MAVKDCVEASRGIRGDDLVDDAMSVLHLRSEALVTILIVSVLFDRCAVRIVLCGLRVAPVLCREAISTDRAGS